MRKTKDYFFFCLKENVIIFDVFDYIEEIAADCVDFSYEWNLVNDKVVSCKKKLLKSFIENKINSDLMHINETVKKTNSKILCFFHKQKGLNEWSLYLFLIQI